MCKDTRQILEEQGSIKSTGVARNGQPSEPITKIATTKTGVDEAPKTRKQEVKSK